MLDELLEGHDQDPPAQELPQSQDPPEAQESLQSQDSPQKSPQDSPQNILGASVPALAEGTSDDEPGCSYWPAHSSDVTILEQVSTVILYFDPNDFILFHIQ